MSYPRQSLIPADSEEGNELPSGLQIKSEPHVVPNITRTIMDQLHAITSGGPGAAKVIASIPEIGQAKEAPATGAKNILGRAARWFNGK